MNCLLILSSLVDREQNLSIRGGQLVADYQKKTFSSRLQCWWSGGESNLRTVVNEVATYCLNLGIGSDAKNLAYYGLTNLKLLQEKAVKHNSRWDVRLLSLFFSRVKCPDLTTSIAAVEALLKQKKQIENVKGLIDYLDKRPEFLTASGIFRACGDHSHVKAFYQLMQGNHWSGLPENIDPGVVTLLLKQSLREIPSVSQGMQSLTNFSSSFYSINLDAIPGKLKAIWEGLEQKDLIKSLFSLLRKVTGLSVRDLAEEMAPSLCGGEEGQGKELIVYLIEHFDEIF